MTTEEIYRTLIKIVKPHNGYTAQLEAIARWVESDFEPKNQGQILPMHGVTLNEVALCDCFRKEKTNMLTGMYCKKHKIFFSMEHNEG